MNWWFVNCEKRCEKDIVGILQCRLRSRDNPKEGAAAGSCSHPRRRYWRRCCLQWPWGQVLPYVYWVTHQVDSNLLLTSNWKLRFIIRSLYCDGTFVAHKLLPPNICIQGDGGLCIWFTIRPNQLLKPPFRNMASLWWGLRGWTRGGSGTPSSPGRMLRRAAGTVRILRTR